MSTRSRALERSGPRRGSLPGCWPALALIVASVGCSSAPAEHARLRERVIAFEAGALERFLAVARTLEDTPLANHARALAAETRDCTELFAHLPDDGRPARPLLHCVDGSADVAAADPVAQPGDDAAADFARDRRSDALAAFARERRGDADGLILWPIGDDGRLELRLRVDAEGGLHAEGSLRPPGDPGGLGLILPDAEPPAPSVISPVASLAHLRARPAGGLRLSALIPTGGQADRLFALKGRLITSALLSGSWELAFMPAAEAGRLPLAVAALHHRAEEPVRLALGEALDQLETTWPIRRSPRRFGSQAFDGGCFLDLPLLPEFAPCWAITPKAVLVGYRAEAIEGALATPAVSSPPDLAAPLETQTATNGTSLEVRLDGFAGVDRSRRAGGPDPHVGEIFSRLSLRLEPTDDERVRVRASLRSDS